MTNLRASLVFGGQDGSPDAQAMADFVRDHARGGVIDRDASVFQGAIDTGVMVSVSRSDPGTPDGERILGLAGILPLADGVFEMGGALVRADTTGFGLQKPMLKARLARFVHRAIAPWDKLVSGAAHADYGSGSRQALERAGFIPMAHEDGPVEFHEECVDCPREIPADRPCCYQYYRAGPACRNSGYEAGVLTLKRKRDGRRMMLSLPELE